jgi:hypothetical protein
MRFPDRYAIPSCRRSMIELHGQRIFRCSAQPEFFNSIRQSLPFNPSGPFVHYALTAQDIEQAIVALMTIKFELAHVGSIQGNFRTLGRDIDGRVFHRKLNQKLVLADPGEALDNS